MSKPRIIELRRRQRRARKLARLRERYRAAESEEERQQVLGKVAKVAPSVGVEDFNASEGK